VLGRHIAKRSSSGEARSGKTAPDAARTALEFDEAPSDEKGPLERYVGVLELIAAFPGALTMSDVAGLMCFPKTTAHRLLSGLKRTGLIEGGGRNRPFRLGERLLRLAPALSEERRITAMA